MPRIRAESIVAHKLASRQAILSAAQKVFLANGYSGGSLTAIADVAGLPRTTIYEYFPSKGHILLAVLEEQIPPLLADLLTDLGDGSALDRITEIYKAGVQLAVAAPDLVDLMFRVGRELPKELRDQMWNLLTPVTRELLRLCDSGAASGEFATSHPERCGQVLADILVSAIDEVSRETEPSVAAADVLQSRLAFVRGGLLAG